jgi:hypothetical protein
MEIGRLPRYGVLSLRKISIALTILGQATWRMVGNPETELGLLANFRVARHSLGAVQWVV